MAAILVGCNESPSAPLLQRRIIVDRDVQQPISAYTFPTPKADTDTVYRAKTGIYIASNSTVIIHVQGALKLRSAAERKFVSNGGIIQGDFTYPLAGRLASPMGLSGINGWPGLTGLALSVKLYYGDQASGPPLHADPTDSTAAVSDTLWTGAGYLLTASRNGLYGAVSCTSHNINPPAPKECADSTGPVYKWQTEAYLPEGGQTITIERLPDDVTLSAVVSYGGRGRSVTFTHQ